MTTTPLTRIIGENTGRINAWCAAADSQPPARYACCEHCEGRQDTITDNHEIPCPHGCTPAPIRPSSRRAHPGLIEEAEAITHAHDATTADITAYGAAVLGRVLGHAIIGDTGTEWHQYTRLLWPAIADGTPGQFTLTITAALAVCDA
jgi:hypothetical protein